MIKSLIFRLVFLSLTVNASSNLVAAPPNIVVVMVDDLSMDAFDVLVDGGWLPQLTTHVVNKGVSFRNSFVTNAACCPSRATFLTGQYSHNHRVFSNHSPHPLKGGIAWPGWFPQNGQAGRSESTIATWLQSAGYTTGFVGKYLNGYGGNAPENVAEPSTYVPPGWSDWKGMIDPTTYRVFDYKINENGQVVQYDEDYQTDVVSGHATDFVKSAATQSAPFFLWIAPLAPHLEVLHPLDVLYGNDPKGGYQLDIRPAQRHEFLIDGDLANGEMPPLLMKPSFEESDVSDKPSCPSPLPATEPEMQFAPFCVGDAALSNEFELGGLNRQFKTMLASMIAVDDLVGSLISELEAANVIDNTVIVFTSDNGWLYGEHRVIGKELPYEESIRVPLVIRAPGGSQGVNANQMVINNDIAPTLSQFAGVQMPYEADGTSFLPLVFNPNAQWFRRAFLVEHWFVPSLFKFEPPTFFALRWMNQDAGFLYVATHSDVNDIETAQHHELYAMSNDAFQTDGIPVPVDLAAMFDDFLSELRTSSGSGCRALESLGGN